MDFENVYYVLLEVNDDKDMFFDLQDENMFLKILKVKLCEAGFNMYAFCLSHRQIYFLISAIDNGIGEVIRRIKLNYVVYFKKKYDKDVYIFKKGFRYNKVKDEKEFKEIIRYTHKIRKNDYYNEVVDKYIGNSYLDYSKELPDYIDTETVFKMFSKNIKLGKKEFIKFNGGESEFEVTDFKIEQDILEEAKSDIANDVIRAFLKRNKTTLEALRYNENKKLKNRLIHILQKENLEYKGQF
ncbi:MAG: hypothetical protein A2Y24_07475 [Clostridiales bacterium GWE2_32_10]|nr:MAG: hypothetical protein A2Y24_07475 [Clostridiales bacterium GWE2_32_10]HBY21317.1 hypothetical protein [Clostridiales bacterium]